MFLCNPGCVLLCVCVLCCFFQAEDGIRDLVRSRGLGDVYKRQGQLVLAHHAHFGPVEVAARTGVQRVRPLVGRQLPAGGNPVSYTHLTLPTSDLV